jgi:CDP-diacylglycerol--glycerol-3-phosphate 3-phosphatidyltransferase
VIKAHFGDRVDTAVRAVLSPLFRYAIHPDLLSWVGAALSLGAGMALASSELRWGAVLIAVGGVFDLVDGVMARHQGRASPFGAFLDSTLDRVADLAILVGITTHFAWDGRPEWVAVTGVALAATVLTSYIKARAERFVTRFEGGLFERAERLILLALGAWFGLLEAAVSVLAVLGAWTVATRFALAYRMLKGGSK